MNSSGNNAMANKDAILALFGKMFPDVGLTFVDFVYKGTIHVFELTFQNIEALTKNWSKVSDTIAVNYQTGLETDFEIWNLYLFYRCDFDVTKSLRYKIENDTLSSRKIVIDKAELSTSDSTLSAIISRHITNEDLKLLTKQQIDEIKSGDFQKDSRFVNALASLPKTGKKPTEEEYSDVLNKLENLNT